MARAVMKLPEDFLLKVSRLAEHTDEILPRVLAAGGAVVEAKVRDGLKTAIGSGTKSPSRSTGQLLGSLGVSSARQDRDGNFNVKVGFAEDRSDGRSNAMIAGVLEYGKHGQSARPFLAPAKRKSKNGCIEAMKEKLESELKKV